MIKTLNGLWLKVLEARHYGNNVEFTPQDLDAIVRNYGSRKEDAPVGVGNNWRGATTFGSVADLRRDGNFLLAKMDRIAPKLEQAYGEAEEPPKFAIALAKTPTGPSLQRVGILFEKPKSPEKEKQNTNKVPNARDLMDDSVRPDAFGNDEVIFSESALESQWLEVFRCGDYGDKGKFGPADLDQIARNYNPLFHEAPVVIGHPKSDAPAYGWVAALKRSGQMLLARLANVNSKFEEMVRDGAFKKRSISLYQSSNGLALRHLGFLGAQPPELKGLANATFNESQWHPVEMEFEEPRANADRTIAHLKAHGRWMDRFDRGGVPVLLKGMEGSRSFNLFVEFLEGGIDQIDLDASLLTERARWWAREHSVSFGEALNVVANTRTKY